MEWGLDRVDQRSGTDGLYDNQGATGEGTYIYVMDTGVRVSHVDFGERASGLWSAGCTGGICSPGYVPLGVITDGDCDNSHGTHCASTAAGNTYGVARGAKVVSVQVLACSDGSGSTAGVLRGLEAIAAHQELHGQPSVVSMSFSGAHVT